MIGTPRLTVATILSATLASGLVTGCEYFRDSPEQDLANRRWKECTSGLHEVKLDRVDMDGRIRFTYVGMNERDNVLACLRNAGEAGARLPDALASAPAGR